MNIFELLILAMIIVSGYFSGKLCASHLGVIGWIFGFIIGIIFAVVALITLKKCSNIFDKRYPIIPSCKNGKCTFDDYEVIKCLEDNSTFFRCKCGIKYIKKGKHFMEIIGDGSAIPYMKRKGILGRWEKDK